MPDPKLSGGLKELPIDTGEAFSLRRDDFTEFTVGTESGTASRRHARGSTGERKQLEAETERSGLDNDRRAIRRDVSLAWLDVYESEQSLLLARKLSQEAALQLQSLEKDYANGKASQADCAGGQGRSRSRRGQGTRLAAPCTAHAGAALARWIGTAAERPLAGAPSLPPPGELPELMTSIDHHPVIAGIDTQIEASATDIALARQAYKPDFAVEGYVAYRPGFSDFVGIQVTMGLPYFTKNRQDPELAAAFERARASKDRKRDLLREMQSRIAQDYVDWRHYGERLAEFDGVITSQRGAARRRRARQLPGRARQLRCRTAGPAQPDRYSAAALRPGRRKNADPGSAPVFRRICTTFGRIPVNRTTRFLLPAALIAGIIVAVVVLSKHRRIEKSPDLAAGRGAPLYWYGPDVAAATLRQARQVALHGHAADSQVCG